MTTSIRRKSQNYQRKPQLHDYEKSRKSKQTYFFFFLQELNLFIDGNCKEDAQLREKSSQQISCE